MALPPNGPPLTAAALAQLVGPRATVADPALADAINERFGKDSATLSKGEFARRNYYVDQDSVEIGKKRKQPDAPAPGQEPVKKRAMTEPPALPKDNTFQQQKSTETDFYKPSSPYLSRQVPVRYEYMPSSAYAFKQPSSVASAFLRKVMTF